MDDTTPGLKVLGREERRKKKTKKQLKNHFHVTFIFIFTCPGQRVDA